VADPGVRMFFQDDKWQAAIPVLQALSIGMAFRVVASPGGSLIQAQGRFRVILITNVINAIIFLTLVTVGAMAGRPGAANLWWRPATTVGIAVAFYFALIGPVFLYIAIRPSGGTWRDIARVYVAPMLVSTFAIAAAMLAGMLVPEKQIRGHRWGQAVRLTVILAWFVAIYVPLIRLVMPEDWRSLMRRVGMLYRSRRGMPEPVATTAAAA